MRENSVFFSQLFMDLLIYNHLFKEVGDIVLVYVVSNLFVCIDGCHFLLKGNTLTKYNERKCFMSHHQCFLTLENQVNIICNDNCPTKDNIGWVNCYKECYDVQCLSRPLNSFVSRMNVSNSGQNGKDSTIDELLTQYLCEHGKKCTIHDFFHFRHKNIENNCALFQDSLLFIADFKLIKLNLLHMNDFESYCLCSCPNTCVEFMIIDGNNIILFSQSKEGLCLHQFDLSEKLWTCFTIENYRDSNSNHQKLTIRNFKVLKGRYIPKTEKRKLYSS